MKISVDENKAILLEEVYNGIGFATNSKEHFRICMRDSGYEFYYGGKWYEAKKGTVLEMIPTNKYNETNKREESNPLIPTILGKILNKIEQEAIPIHGTKFARTKPLVDFIMELYQIEEMKKE